MLRIRSNLLRIRIQTLLRYFFGCLAKNFWHFLTKCKNQKVCLKIILGNDYREYETALEHCKLESLEARRDKLSLFFAQKCVSSSKHRHLFPVAVRDHDHQLRHQELYHVNHARTEKYRKSAVPYRQRKLNQDIVKIIDIKLICFVNVYHIFDFITINRYLFIYLFKCIFRRPRIFYTEDIQFNCAYFLKLPVLFLSYPKHHTTCVELNLFLN